MGTIALSVGITAGSAPEGQEALEKLLASGASPDVPAAGKDGSAPLVLLAQKDAMLVSMRAREVLADGPTDLWETIAARPREAASGDIVHSFIAKGGAQPWHCLLAQDSMPVAWYRVLHGVIMLLQLQQEQATSNTTNSGRHSPASPIGGTVDDLMSLKASGSKSGWRARTQLRDELLEHFDELTELAEQAEMFTHMLQQEPETASRTLFEAESNSRRTAAALLEQRRTVWQEFVTQLGELDVMLELAELMPATAMGSAQRAARDFERERRFGLRFRRGIRAMSKQSIFAALEPQPEPPPAAEDGNEDDKAANGEQGDSPDAARRDQKAEHWHESDGDALRMMTLKEWEHVSEYIQNQNKVLDGTQFRRLRFLATAEPALALALGVCHAVLHPPRIPPAAWPVLEAAVAADPSFEGMESSADVAAAAKLLKLCQDCKAYSLTSSCMGVLLRAGANLTTKNADGSTVLHMACHPARPCMLAVILQHARDSPHLCAAIHQEDASQRIPAAVVLGKGTYAEQECLALLLDAGTMVSPDGNGTPGGVLIQMAAGAGKSSELLSLLTCAGKHHASLKLIDWQDAQGFTPLILAIREGQHRCVELLLHRRANVQICDAQRRSPLGHAVAVQDDHAVKLVLRAANKEQRRALLVGDADDQGPLFVAARHPTAVALRTMMAEVSMLWRVEEELELHIELITVALMEPSEECATYIMQECTTLQSRMLDLMRLCVEMNREVMLPIIYKHAVATDMVAQDANGETLLHVLANMTEDYEPGENPATCAAMRRLAMLLNARPDLELLALNAEGFTALGAAPNAHCSQLLMDAVLRMLPRAVLSIVICKLDMYVLGTHANQMAEELAHIFPGLTPQINPMSDMQPGEEGSPGSFEVVWEADDCRCTKLLCSLLQTGVLPTVPQVATALLQHLIGPAASPESIDLLGEVMMMAPRPESKVQITSLGLGSRSELWPNLPQSRVKGFKSSVTSSSLSSRSQSGPLHAGYVPRSLQSSSISMSVLLPPVSRMCPPWQLLHPLRRTPTAEYKFRLDPLVEAGREAAKLREEIKKLSPKPKKVVPRRRLDLTSIDLDEGPDAPPIAEQLANALRDNSARVLDLFRSWDSDSNGQVTRAEFHKAMRALSLEAPKAAIDELFSSWDKDGGGEIGYQELRTLLSQSSRSNSPSTTTSSPRPVSRHSLQKLNLQPAFSTPGGALAIVSSWARSELIRMQEDRALGIKDDSRQRQVTRWPKQLMPPPEISKHAPFPPPTDESWIACLDADALRPYYHCVGMSESTWYPPNAQLQDVGEKLVADEKQRRKLAGMEQAAAAAAKHVSEEEAARVVTRKRTAQRKAAKEAEAAVALKRSPSKIELMFIQREMAMETRNEEIRKRAEEKAEKVRAGVAKAAEERAAKKAAGEAFQIGWVLAAEARAAEEKAAKAASEEFRQMSVEIRRAVQVAEFQAVGEEARAAEEARKKAAAEAARKKAAEEVAAKEKKEKEAAEREKRKAAGEAKREAEAEARRKAAAEKKAEVRRRANRAGEKEGGDGGGTNGEVEAFEQKDGRIEEPVRTETEQPIQAEAGESCSGAVLPADKSSPKRARRHTAWEVTIPYASMRVLADFEPEQAGELAVSMDDFVLVLQPPVHGWVHVAKLGAAPSKGFAPYGYLEAMAKPEVVRSLKALVGTPAHGTLLEDFEGQSPLEVPKARQGASVWRLAPEDGTGWVPVLLEDGTGGQVPVAIVAWT